jgi:hypothetical protein
MLALSPFEQMMDIQHKGEAWLFFFFFYLHTYLRRSRVSKVTAIAVWLCMLDW